MVIKMLIQRKTFGWRSSGISLFRQSALVIELKRKSIQIANKIKIVKNPISCNPLKANATNELLLVKKNCR